MRKATFLATILLLLASARSAAGYTKNVAVVIFDGVEVLDLAAPVEVFAIAGQIASNRTESAFNVYTVATSRTPIVSQGVLDVTADYALADAPKPDILVIPGGRGSWNAIKDQALMSWIKSSAANADHVLTICYGSFIAGKADLLDGLDITTWYGSIPLLQSEFPTSRAHAGRRFLDNGKVITTAGVSAGLDGSLHLVARTLGRYVADRTAEYMEYPWTPQSHTSSTYGLLNPRLDGRGRKLQQATIATRGNDLESALATYRDLITNDIADTEAWLLLGRTLHSAKRHSEAIAAYSHAANGKDQRATALYNLACAYALTGEKEKSIQTAQRAVEAGFTAKAMFQRDPDFASVRDDARFQRLME